MQAQRRYVIRGLIKAGGEGEVLEALQLGDLGFSKQVAIKRMNATDDERALRAFVDEAQVLSQLTHPNIVSILDFGITALGRPFQVLEYVEGYDLEEMLLRCKQIGRHVPTAVALYIATEVLQALSYAHQAAGLNVVHRDVSPHNVLIDTEGQVKLADFGIATFETRKTKTAVGVTKGKVDYMAPEQVMAADVDGRADLFSLGCVLHQMLTGVSPLDDAEARQRLLMREPITLHEDCPEPIVPIIAKAIQADRTRRYDNAEAMATDCADLLAEISMSTPRNALCAFLEHLQEEALLTTRTVLPTVPEQMVFDEGTERFSAEESAEETWEETDAAESTLDVDTLSPDEPRRQNDRPTILNPGAEDTVMDDPPALPTPAVAQPASASVWWGWGMLGVLALILFALLVYRELR